MYSVSVKGIVLGSLFDLVVSFVFGIVLIFVLTVSNGGNPDVAMAAMNSGGWFAFQMVVGFALTVIAGYLAAWIAGRGEMINGTLSAVFTMAIMIPMMAGQPLPWSMTVMVILYILTPLFGLLGGYLRWRLVNGG
jgi:hypothetical protein